MSLKLKDSIEIGMWFEGKKRNMSEEKIKISIQVLRLIREIGRKK